MCLVDRSYLWQRTAKCLLLLHKIVDWTSLLLTVLASLLPPLTSRKKNVSSNYVSPYSSYEWSVLQEAYQKLNKTFLKRTQSYCWSFVALIKYLKVKITAADINLAIIKMARVRARNSFPQYWKQSADFKEDQAKKFNITRTVHRSITSSNNQQDAT